MEIKKAIIIIPKIVHTNVPQLVHVNFVKFAVVMERLMIIIAYYYKQAVRIRAVS